MRFRGFCIILLFATSARGQAWTERVRGSLISNDNTGITLVAGDRVCNIVVAPTEASNVKQAATFLAGDIEKITGKKPAIIEAAQKDHCSIILTTVGGGNVDHAKWPWSFSPDDWEAYQIRTIDQDQVILAGSNPRGTAFAAYTFAERIGVDPLYLWTGYQPDRHDPLIVKTIDFCSGPPTFKYRGMFHDDEDILPRPFEPTGYPLRTGDVPSEWYAKYFETALRLRMNMVAPYTRVHRRFEVQKMASDWGLFYTSHHYDILLSNPFGIERYGLGKARGLSGDWDWINNRDGMLRYWRGGVDENKDLDCIWPVGMRGTDDTGYKFPHGTSEAEQSKVFRDVIAQQVKMTKDALPPGKEAVFHWTLYTEMLPKYLSGKLEVPDDVIIVWPDDNDGNMRGLPEKKDRWKHGVYYHLAYLGKPVKQSLHMVPPVRIAGEFKKIVAAGATQYMLFNVSELREFVMEARMLGEIGWDAKTALAGDDPAKRYVDWWSREYFGDKAAPDAARAYGEYAKVYDSFDKQWFGSERVHSILGDLSNRIRKPGTPTTLPSGLRDELNQRAAGFDAFLKASEAATKQMSWPQRQFFFDHLELPAMFDYRATVAAGKLLDAVDSKDDADALSKSHLAIAPLETLETDILRAEHPPFENWYRETWIRRGPKPINVHRPYEEMRLFLSTGGREFALRDPEPSHRRAATAATTQP